jgi:hypothetical protein
MAQNNTNSPYSRYGYGELRDPGFGRSQAMGGTGIGSRDKYSINPANPASYSAIDTLSFMCDFGVSGLLSQFSDQSRHASTYNGSFDYLAVQFPLAKWMAASIGVMPYSFAGYNYSIKGRLRDINITSKNEKLDIYDNTDTIGYQQTFSGNGAISQLYGGLSVKLFNHLALGVNATYIFGSNQYSRALSITDSTNSSKTIYSTNQTISLDVRALSMRYGIQYFTNIGKRHQLTIGAVFQPKVNFHGNYSQITTTVSADTVTVRPLTQSPLQFGGGFSYTYDNRLTIAADFMTQQWAKAAYFGKTDSLNNRTKISLGAEYQDNPYGNSYLKRMSFRAGLSYSNTYIDAYGYSPKCTAVTFGMGFPIRFSNSPNTTMINTTFEYGIIGKASATSLRENYFRFSLGITFNEMWFFKRKL